MLWSLFSPTRMQPCVSSGSMQACQYSPHTLYNRHCPLRLWFFLLQTWLLLLKFVVHILNILAVAIQLNDHANKAESPILQHQANELDYKSSHISQDLIVSNFVLCRSFLSRGRQNLFALTFLLVQANARRAIREYTLRGQLVSDFLRFYFLFSYLFYQISNQPQNEFTNTQ